MALSNDFQNRMTIGGVECVELEDGSGRGTISAAFGRAERRFLCDWSNLATFAATLIGGWRLTGTAQEFVPPNVHPDFSNWYCIELDFDHLGTPSVTGARSAWTYAVLTAIYGPPQFDPENGDPEENVEVELDMGGCIVSIPGGTLQAPGGAKKAEPVSKRVSQGLARVRIRGASGLPNNAVDFAAVLSLLGKVNSEPVFGAPAETVLFEGARVRRSGATFDAVTRTRWDVEMGFAIQLDPTWNQQFYPTVGWARGTNPATGDTQYEIADLRVLWP